MAFFRIIFFLLFFAPAMFFLSGCYDDAFLEAMNEEVDFIAPFDVVLNDVDSKRTVSFPIAETGSFTQILNANSTSHDVVEDNVTGLMWTKCSATGFNEMNSDDACTGSAAKLSWNEAFQTCDSLTYATYTDWRLPTLPELFTLIDFNNDPQFNVSFFPDNDNTANNGYWTATSKLFLASDSYDVTDHGWVLFFKGYFFNIINSTFIKKLSYDSGTGSTTVTLEYVRCVRNKFN